MQLPLCVSVANRGSPAAAPLAQGRTAWTFRITDVLLPIENVPENWKLLSRPKWPLPTWVYVAPPSVEAQTRTSGFVRAAVVMLLLGPRLCREAHRALAVDASPNLSMMRERSGREPAGQR